MDVKDEKSLLIVKIDIKPLQIAQNVGHPNPLYFSTIFTKLTGVSP